jgi:hypothetical protein
MARYRFISTVRDNNAPNECSGGSVCEVPSGNGTDPDPILPPVFAVDLARSSGPASGVLRRGSRR